MNLAISPVLRVVPLNQGGINSISLLHLLLLLRGVVVVVVVVVLVVVITDNIETIFVLLL